MIGVWLAHMGGLPIEETIGLFGPALLAGLGAALATVRARVRAMRSNEEAGA